METIISPFNISGTQLSGFGLNNNEVPTNLRKGIYLVKVINKSEVYNPKKSFFKRLRYE